jgi:hypothetical protein
LISSKLRGGIDESQIGAEQYDIREARALATGRQSSDDKGKKSSTRSGDGARWKFTQVNRFNVETNEQVLIATAPVDCAATASAL